MKFKLLFLTLVFSAMACLAHANNGNPGNGEENKKLDIGGGVVNADNKKPLTNVSVTAYNNSKKEKTVLTDNLGNYSFTDLKPGTYRLVFEKTGYKKVTREKVSIRVDEGCQLNIEMDEEADFQILPGSGFFDF